MLKQRKPLRRTAIKRKEPSYVRETHPSAEERKAAHMAALMTPSQVRGSYAGSVSGAVPKAEPKRNPTLLAMAQGRRCLFGAVEECEGAAGFSTVACHENKGKGMGQKKSDERSAWGCWQCHRWYDQSGAKREAKRAAFMLAHLSQVLEWRRIVADVGEPERFRKAAQWALDQLGATPVGEMG